MATTDRAGDAPRFYVPGVSRYFKATLWRRGDGSVDAEMRLRPDLADADGALRLGALAYLVDVATGICSGVAVVERGLWIVTTDLHLEVIEPVTVGPVGVRARTVRAGATTVVSRFEVTDLGRDGKVVGGGTATNRPFPFEGDIAVMQFPVDVPMVHDDGTPVTDEPILSQLGATSVDDGAVEVELVDRLRNPWGILHGGVTGVLVDHAAELVSGGRRPRGASIRYLSPGRVGPVRAVPTVVTSGAEGMLVQVEVRDRGQDDRLMALATVTMR